MLRTTLTIALIAGATLAADDYRIHEEQTITRTLRFGQPGEPRTVDVRNLHGSIRVTSGPADRVEFRALRTIAARSEDDARRGERESVLSVIDGLPKVEVVVQEPNGPICGEQWEGGWQRRPRYHVTYDMTVSVPAQTTLRLCTINGREITVTGTSGDFEIDNTNGAITLDGVRGSGSARTVNGRVRATLLERPRLDGEFTSINGEVAVTWPADLAARLRMKTFNGGLFTDFDATALPAPRPVAERRNGYFVYRSSAHTEVQVGRGGPTITLESFNGNVRVLRAAR